MVGAGEYKYSSSRIVDGTVCEKGCNRWSQPCRVCWGVQSTRPYLMRGCDSWAILRSMYILGTRLFHTIYLDNRGVFILMSTPLLMIGAGEDKYSSSRIVVRTVYGKRCMFDRSSCDIKHCKFTHECSIDSVLKYDV